jgi:hypothetical protein
LARSQGSPLPVNQPTPQQTKKPSQWFFGMAFLFNKFMV